MKGPRLGCLTLLILFVCFQVWVRTPRDRYAEPIARSSEQLAKLEREWADLYLPDKAANGYYNPEFHPFWRVRSEGLAPTLSDTDPQKVLSEAMSRTTDGISSANATDAKKQTLRALIEKRDPEFMKAIGGFEALQPDVLKVLESKTYTPPLVGSGFNREVPNFIGIRRFVQCTSAYLHYLDVSGKSDQAAHLAALLVKWPQSWAPPHNLIHLMIKVSCQAVVRRPLREILRRGQKLSVASLQELNDALAQCADPEALPQSLEYEIKQAHDGMASATALLSSTTKQPASMELFTTRILFTLGIMQRELRLYDNQFYPWVLHLRNQGPQPPTPQISSSGFSSVWDDISGKQGIFAAILLPNTERARANFNLNQAVLAGLRISANLHLYRAKKGSYPQRLEELKEVGLSPIPANPLGDPWSYELKDGKPELSCPSPKSGVSPYIEEDESGKIRFLP